MKKIRKLKICNWSLILLTLAILVSGIYLEATDSSGVSAVWIHFGLATLFFIFAAYHIYLHFGSSNWFTKFHKLRSQFTRVLWWVSFAAFVSGVAAWLHWFTTLSHSPIGGIHGKIGFLMIALLICHIAKRIQFFPKSIVR